MFNPDDLLMNDGEPMVFTGTPMNTAASADCTLDGTHKTMVELRKRFPDPPIKRIRVTQAVYSSLKARFGRTPDDRGEEPVDWPFEAMRLRGVPVVVDLPADHQPGHEVEYQRTPPAGCEHIDATRIRAEWRKARLDENRS